MKRITAILLSIILLTAILTACGNIANVQRTKVDSEFFTQEEIDEAIDVVLDYFKHEFDGCTLKEIKYAGDEQLEEYHQQKDDDFVYIVLTSTFTTGPNEQGSAGPNALVEDYTWTLVRHNGGKWEIKSWGWA